LIASLSSTHYFFGADKPTTFNLFFERKSGLPGTLSFDTTQVLQDIKRRLLVMRET